MKTALHIAPFIKTDIMQKSQHARWEDVNTILRNLESWSNLLFWDGKERISTHNTGGSKSKKWVKEWGTAAPHTIPLVLSHTEDLFLKIPQFPESALQNQHESPTMKTHSMFGFQQQKFFCLELWRWCSYQGYQFPGLLTTHPHLWDPSTPLAPPSTTHGEINSWSKRTTLQAQKFPSWK